MFWIENKTYYLGTKDERMENRKVRFITDVTQLK